jgi:hypothetical protein
MSGVLCWEGRWSGYSTARASGRRALHDRRRRAHDADSPDFAVHRLDSDDVTNCHLCRLRLGHLCPPVHRRCSAQRNCPRLRSTCTTVIRSACSRSVRPIASAADVASERTPTLIEIALLIIAGLRASGVRVRRIAVDVGGQRQARCRAQVGGNTSARTYDVRRAAGPGSGTTPDARRFAVLDSLSDSPSPAVPEGGGA